MNQPGCSGIWWRWRSSSKFRRLPQVRDNSSLAFAEFAGIRWRSGPVRVKLLEDFLSCLLKFHAQALQDSRGDTVTLTNEAKQNVFGAKVSMVKRFGFLGGQGEHFVNARRVRNIADGVFVGACPDLPLDFPPDGVEIDAHFLEYIDGDALPEIDQTEQNMLSADKVMIESLCLLPSESQSLLRMSVESQNCLFHFNNFLLRFGN